MLNFKLLKIKYPLIGDVRGEGLFLGVELVSDRITLKPAVDETKMIVEKMKDAGILLSIDGPLHNIIKIKPPLVFNQENSTPYKINCREILIVPILQAIAKVIIIKQNGM